MARQAMDRTGLVGGYDWMTATRSQLAILVRSRYMVAPNGLNQGRHLLREAEFDYDIKRNAYRFVLRTPSGFRLDYYMSHERMLERGAVDEEVLSELRFQMDLMAIMELIFDYIPPEAHSRYRQVCGDVIVWGSFAGAGLFDNIDDNTRLAVRFKNGMDWHCRVKDLENRAGELLSTLFMMEGP
jgi:hypothetical protein